jgi:hypothetical protein
MTISEQIQEKFIAYPPEIQYYNFNSFYIPSQYVMMQSERRQAIRVILGRFGGFVKMSAPKINIVVDGLTVDEAWTKFLKEIQTIDEEDWLEFDIGPTRPEEIAEGLNAPEDEDWSEFIEDTEE